MTGHQNTCSNMAVIWSVALCSLLDIYRRLGGIYCRTDVSVFYSKDGMLVTTSKTAQRHAYIL